MIAANLLINTQDGNKKTQALIKNERVDCVEIDTYNRLYYPIREPYHDRNKIYNFHFLTGNLHCTYDHVQ